MQELKELKEKFAHIPIQDVLDYIDTVCGMDYDESNRIFEENKSQFVPFLIKWGMIRKRPEHAELYKKRQNTYVKEYKHRNYLKKLKEEKEDKERKEGKTSDNKPFF